MRTQKEFEAAVSLRQNEIIKNFDDNELRVRRKENGLKCGPIPTPAIRKSWAKRLAQKLVEAEMSQVEESSSGEDYVEEWETKPEFTEIPEQNTNEEQNNEVSDELTANNDNTEIENENEPSEQKISESSSSWVGYLFVFFIVSALTAYLVHQYGNLL